MPFLFLDTSAFVKLYLKEKGSVWIRNLIKNNQIFISELTLAETTNTTTRLFRDSLISRRKVTSVLTSISNLNSNFEIIPLEIENQLGKIASLGLSLPPNLRLRTLDALQLVAAEFAKTDILVQDPSASFVFVSSDIKLLQVAQARGFITENPENYP
jgi:predicted nucleic acid-binding protein